MLWKYILFGLLWTILGIVVLYLLVWIISPLFISKKVMTYDRNSKFYRWLLYSSTGIAMKILRVKIHITGFEKMPAGRFLLVCNHRSNFDPIISWYAWRKYDLAFISKPENFNYFIYGRIIRKCCFLPIDRSNPRSSMKTILDAVDLIKRDEVSIAVYPEGTRSKKYKLLKFHAGVFKIAQKAKVPVVVATIQGGETIKERYPWRRSHIYIDVLDVFDRERVASSTTDELSADARMLMVQKLEPDTLETIDKGE
ncbi:1-acyl-sn-glycerol-3-phosphate acyltransferase [Ruminococcaceae bacterium YRB3002]|nr:1-acyl-sn-glycerol-3-phosphate acyltransferase [Ruminococcaceae bacterium YRB3002]